MSEEATNDPDMPKKNVKSLSLDLVKNDVNSRLKMSSEDNVRDRIDSTTNTKSKSLEDVGIVPALPKQVTKETNKKSEATPQNKLPVDIEGLGSPSGYTSSNNLLEASNKSMISNLNKSLRAKQKIINSKDSHQKPSPLISEVVNTSPKAPNFLSHISGGMEYDGDNASFNMPTNPTPSAVQTPTTDTSLKARDKNQRKIAKQASTRTDFFAAKLASAVDDVDTSDSDETFVYETNANDLENQPSTNPGTLSIQNASVEDVNAIPRNSPHINEHKYQEPPNRAESIHSTQSNKIPPLKNSNPQHNNQKTPIERTYAPSISNSINSNNLYLETHHAKERRPSHQRSYSSNSNYFNNPNSEEGKHHTVTNTLSDKSHPLSFYNPAFSIPEMSQGSNNGIGLLDIRHGFNQGNCIVDYNDGHYSYDEVEDEDEEEDENIEDEEVSEIASESGYDATNAKLNVSNATLKQEDLVSGAKNNLRQISNLNSTNTNSINSKIQGRKKNKSSTSSKLRSTTSKLFDKRGSQPRRYSIIPDDIDIEDFDDELIYYDNNIRFPHNGSNLNESTSLLHNGHRIPHYKSLNLSSNQRSPLSKVKSKRYLSTGHPFLMNSGGSPNPDRGNSKGDIFPFPHSEAHQNYYYDIDEYDEEQQAHRIMNDNNSQFNDDALGHLDKGQYRYGNHFSLPRKRSHITLRISYIKSFMYTLISITCILSVGFIMGFLLATNKDLGSVSISKVIRPVVSEDELIFDIAVKAFNPGWFSISIEDVELDIFAKSGYLNTENSGVETVLLGTVLQLDSPIEFKGGIINKEPVEHITQIKLMSPGKNLTSIVHSQVDINKELSEISINENKEKKPDNSDQWQVISKNPFDLIIRGVLKYHLPLSKDMKSVVVEKVSYIDPSTPLILD